METPVRSWGADRVGDLTELVTAAMPAEALSADELLACCWDDPGVVLGATDGCGAIGAGVTRDADGQVTAVAVKLVAVHPGPGRGGGGPAPPARARGRGAVPRGGGGGGVGGALRAELGGWAGDPGAPAVTLGAAAPFYLWPGVDVRALAMSCLAEQAGYRDLGLALNMSVPSTFRAAVP